MTGESFAGRVTDWFRDAARDLPWRSTDDPYRIWVSEIMLQQTQVTTVLEYYDDFLEQFPTVETLAAADQDEVLKAWEGLGYYARARRMHRAAQMIVDDFDGRLPHDAETLQSLPGIGEYTAAAIASFAFDARIPVVDSNVLRVVCRLENIGTPVDRTDTQRRVEHYVEEAIKTASDPAAFSEGLIELGAMICTPRDPDCPACPVCEDCRAFEQETVDEVPVTGERPDRPHYEVTAGVLWEDGEVLIARRPEDRMLGGLWEFPGGKQEDGESLREALRREFQEELGVEIEVGDKITKVPHEYSHLSINLHAFWCRRVAGDPESREGQPWKWVRPECLDDHAFPGANQPILEAIDETLNEA